LSPSPLLPPSLTSIASPWPLLLVGTYLYFPLPHARYLLPPAPTGNASRVGQLRWPLTSLHSLGKLRLCASPHVQRSFAWTPSPGVLLTLPLPSNARVSPELPGHPQAASLQASRVRLRADHVFPLQVYRLATCCCGAGWLSSGHGPAAGRHSGIILGCGHSRSSQGCWKRECSGLGMGQGLGCLQGPGAAGGLPAD